MLNALKDAVAAVVAYVQKYPAAAAGVTQILVTVAALEGLHLSTLDASVLLSMVMAVLAGWVHSSVTPVIK